MTGPARDTGLRLKCKTYHGGTESRRKILRKKRSSVAPCLRGGLSPTRCKPPSTLLRFLPGENHGPQSSPALPEDRRRRQAAASAKPPSTKSRPVSTGKTSSFSSTSAKTASSKPTTSPEPSTSAKASSSATSKPSIPTLDTPLVLYCGGGFRSALAADNLQKMGYTNVISMDGGIREWREKSLSAWKSRR